MSNRFNWITESFIVSATAKLLETQPASKESIVQHVLTIDSAFVGHEDRLRGFIGDFIDGLVDLGQIAVDRDGLYTPTAEWK